MSFFDGVKKFVDGVTLPSGQVSERKEEIINELKEKKEVAGNPLLLTILNEYKNMEQVEFGIESIPADVDIYREFLIEDKNEVIIAVVKGKKGLLGKYGVKALFTSQALYCLPENEGYRYINDNKVNGNCIQYSDISKYVLCASNNRNHIWLEGYEGKFDVIKKSMVSAVISNNSIEESLIFLFELVQEFEMKHDKTSKVNRNKLCEWLVEKTMDEKLRTGEIASTEEMINSMKHEKEYACKLYSLLLKCAVYSYSDDKISSTIDEMEKRVSEKDIEKILITFEEDVRAFAKNLADINCEYSVTFLHSMGQQFSLASTPETLFNLEIFSEDYEDKIKKRALEIFYTNKYKIGLHARLRKSPTADIDDVVRSMQFFEINEEEKIKRTINFQMMLRNRSMIKAFEIIKKGEKIPYDYIDGVDGFGLNPLHYGILLRNDEQIKFCMKKMDLLNERFRFCDEDLSNLLEYGTLLKYCGKEEYIEEIIEKSSGIKELIKDVKRIESEIKWKERIIRNAERVLSRKQQQYKSGQYSQEERDDLQDEIESLRDEIFDTKEMIKDYKENLEDMRSELEDQKMFERTKYSDSCNKLRNGKSFEAVLFRELFSSVELLYEELSGNKSDYDTYSLLFSYIFMSKDLYEKIYSCSTGFEDIADEFINETIFDRPYGESWFSDEAHLDKAKLKKEYKVLVTKYHPDNNPNTTREFLDIQKEREQILKSLNKEE